MRLGGISTSGPLFQYVTEPGDFYGQNNLFLSTRRLSPVDRSLVAKALNPSLFRRACRMAISRNACSLLDFPEFAQAVRYGVPGTPSSTADHSLVAGGAQRQWLQARLPDGHRAQ